MSRRTWCSTAKVAICSAPGGMRRGPGSGQSATERRFAHEKTPLAVPAISPDGRFVATLASNTRAAVWHIESGERVAETPDSDAFIFDMAFSPDGELLATACADNVARVIDVASARVIDVLPHAGMVGMVGFSDDGRLLATASNDGHAKVWSRFDAPFVEDDGSPEG